MKELQLALHHERRGVEGARQALADKERQLAVLVAEVERLQGRQVRRCLQCGAR